MIQCFFIGMAGTVPFMQVLAKDLGISATAVGLIYTIVPFCVFLAKPLFGFLTDFFRNIKIILMLLVITTAAAFLSILLVPPIEELKETVEITAMCTAKVNELVVQPVSNNSACAQDLVNKQFNCEFTSHCLKIENIPGKLNISKNNGKDNVSFLFTFASGKYFPSPQDCDCIKTNYSYIACDSNVFECSSEEKKQSEYRTLTFWMFAFLAIIAGAGSASTFCLSDAACYEVLGHNPQLYGRQRMWATISWGIVTFLAGYLNDVATNGSPKTNYSPGFYLMLAFVIVDLIIVAKVHLVKGNISSNICKDISKIYSSWQTVIFSFGIYIGGALTGLIWNYEFWYLTDLGASSTLLGLVVAVQCLIAEVPFFFFSEWFIVKFGHFYCLVGSFAAFALRTGLYVLIKNPWLVLPIEVLHGATFAIFYTAMTLYAAHYAPPGTEATMLGVLGGLYEGIGKFCAF